MTDSRTAILSLLVRRAPTATICPSEVARAISPDWRGAMPAVHAAVDGLVRDELVQLSWKGRPSVARSGPYRISRLGDV
jgi:predicted DNA-binding transcriptional regulator